MNAVDGDEEEAAPELDGAVVVMVGFLVEVGVAEIGV